MIGKAANVRRLAVILVLAGSVGCTRASAAFTSSKRLEHIHIPVKEQIDFRGARGW